VGTKARVLDPSQDFKTVAEYARWYIANHPNDIPVWVPKLAQSDQQEA